MGSVIGIDLGTSNSVVAHVKNGEATVIDSSEGSELIPSVVAVNQKTGERYVGQVAKRQAVINSDSTIFSVKRLMGRKYTDKQLQKDIKRLPYKVVKADNGDAHVVMGDKTYSPQEISAMVLGKIKADAETKLGEKITDAVVTVPAYFSDAQRQATKDAATIAGLNCLRIINEPTASALAYGLDKRDEATIAVFDLGGGTFDISILRLGDGVFEVNAVNGDTLLGGDDFDEKIMDWIATEFQKDQGVDLKTDKMSLQRLKEAAEKAKVELSSTTQTEINLPFITADASGPKHLVMTLTRAQLEKLSADLIERTMGPCKAAMDDAKLTPKDIDEVVLVGGMTRMPAVIEKVGQIFSKEPNRSVNPDEVVGLGAAVQAGVLKGEVREVLLLDVTPLTMGLETLGGVMTAQIPRNTTIPTSKAETFSTAADSQTSVEIHVLQGERPMAKDNKSIGKFILDGILPAPRGVPQVEVTFDIDSNGILSVFAKDKATGKEQKIVIEDSSGLDKEDIDRMVREAEEFSEEDSKHREEMELRNQADSLVYGAEKLLRDNGDKIDAQLKSEVEDKVKLIKDALQAEDIENVSPLLGELSTILQKVGSVAYESPQEGAAEDEEAKPTDADVDDQGASEDKGKDAEEGEFREA